MKPKKRLKEIYDEYLEKSKTYFMNLKEDNILLLTQKCGFSTISECRKAINELENSNKHLEDSLNAIDKVIKEQPEKVKEITEKVKNNWSFKEEDYKKGSFDYWWNYFKDRHLPETEEDYKAIASLIAKVMCEDAFNFNRYNYNSVGQNSPDFKIKVWFHQTFEEYYKNKDMKLPQ